MPWWGYIVLVVVFLLGYIIGRAAEYAAHHKQVTLKEKVDQTTKTG